MLFKSNPYASDNSPRTNTIKHAYYVLVGCLSVICLSVVGFIFGQVKYSDVLANSSTAIGTEMTFGRSGATCLLSGIYTDEAQSIAVARISFANRTDSLKMPFRATDYVTFVHSDVLPSNIKEMSVITGRLSSDGDMFVVIPKPDPSAVYSVFIMNKNYLAVDADKDGTSQGDESKDPVDITEVKGSLTSALSQYRYQPNEDSSSKSAYEFDSDTKDVIGFRITLSPSLDEPAYKPIVVKGRLLSESGEFDYKGFFKRVFVDSARVELNRKFEELINRQEMLERQLSEYQARLEENKDDTDAATAYTKVEDELNQIKQKKMDVADLIQAYFSLNVSDKAFHNMNDKAYVI